MNKHSVTNEKQALLYLTECLLATVSDMASKKSRKKHEYERHIAIAQMSVDWIKDFGLDVGKCSRVKDVLMTKSKSVTEWAIKFESN